MAVLTTIKRGVYEGTVVQNGNQYFAVVYNGKIKLKEAGPYYDQDEAEVELGTLIDDAWRETASPKGKLVRRM